jgi:hypothetical protein
VGAISRRDLLFKSDVQKNLCLDTASSAWTQPRFSAYSREEAASLVNYLKTRKVVPHDTVDSNIIKAHMLSSGNPREFYNSCIKPF